MFRLTLALWYLVTRPIMLLPVLGLMLGVGTLVVVHSVMNGFSATMIQRIRGLSSDVSVRSESGQFFYDVTDLASGLKALSVVKAVSPDLEFLAMRHGVERFPGRSVEGGFSLHSEAGVQVHGIDLKQEERVSDIGKYFYFYDAWMEPHEGRSRSREFVSQEIFRSKSENAFEQGQQPLLITGCDNMMHSIVGPHPFFLITIRPDVGMSFPIQKEFQSVGEFCSGMYEYDSTRDYIPLAQAQKLFGIRDGANHLSIQLQAGVSLLQGQEAIQKFFERYHVPVSVTTWREEKAYLLEAVEVEKGVIQIIIFLIILVAAFSVSALLYILVVTKTKELGILASLGASPADIYWIFVLIGGVIAFLGIGLGLVAGIEFAEHINGIAHGITAWTGLQLFPKQIYFLASIPIDIRVSTLAVFSALSFIVTLMSSFYPAWKAMRLAPAQALRYE